MKSFNNTKLLALVIIIIALGAGLFEIERPRELWDERSRYMSGLSYWKNIADANFDAESWSINSVHPPMAKYMYGLVNGAYLAFTSPNVLTMDQESALPILDDIKTMVPSRLLVLILAIGIYLITFLIGSELFNKRVGFISALLLIFFPMFTSHVRISNLDIPMVFFFMLSVLFVLRGIRSKSKNSKYYLLFGISSGFAVSSLFSGGLALIVGILIFLIHKITLKQKIDIPLYLVISPLIMFFILYISWPWLWFDPIGKLFESLGWWNLYYTAGPMEFFIGELISPGINYFITYLVFTTPIFVIILSIFSLLYFDKKNNYNIILVWFLSVLLIISFIPTKLNGNTYILALYPALAILAALGLEKIYNMWGKNIFLGITTITIIYLVISSALVHPFYLDYYNEISGGQKNIYETRSFRLGAWGEGLDYAVDYINMNAPTNSTIEFHASPIHILRGFRSDIIQENAFFLENQPARSSQFIADYSFHNADYIIKNIYYEWYINESFDPISLGYSLEYIIKVRDADIVKIYKKIKTV